MLAVIVAVLVVANLLNNWLAPRAYLVTCPVTTGVLVGLTYLADGTAADLGLAPAKVPAGLRWGGAAIALVLAGYAALAALPSTRGLLVDRRVPAGRRAMLFQALGWVPFGTVLLEEVAFRGVIYGLVSRVHGLTAAVAVSSLLFGVWHVLPARELAAANPTAAHLARGRPALAAVGAVVLTGLVGLLLCELRRRSGSLLAPMGLHLATNTVGYLAVFAVTRRR